ncbi:MAG: ribonuclease P protein component [Planctomycetes bacterium]|nr:ribonuclease P protein component [Planctomycetota bacterium]
MDQRLRRTERLQHAFEFRAVFDRGGCFRTGVLRVHFLRTDRDLSRLGLVVSRRVGDAVVRNRVKRLLREVFRRSKGELPAPMDIVLLPQGPPRTHREYLEAYRRFLAKVQAEAACAR